MGRGTEDRGLEHTRNCALFTGCALFVTLEACVSSVASISIDVVLG